MRMAAKPPSTTATKTYYLDTIPLKEIDSYHGFGETPSSRAGFTMVSLACMAVLAFMIGRCLMLPGHVSN